MTYVFEGDFMYEVAPDGSRTFKGTVPGRKPQAENQTYGTGYYGQRYSGVNTYSPTRFWDGVDRRKFPNTWRWLVKFYYLPDFNRHTTWKSDVPTTKATPAVTSNQSDNPYSWEGYFGDGD